MATKTSDSADFESVKGVPLADTPVTDAVVAPREETVGVTLKRERERQGSRPIIEIAEEIRVRPHQLEALEADDYEKLPGLIYAAGFIRAYAQNLGLDGQEMVDRFKRTARTEDLESHLSFPEPLDDPRIPRRSLVAVACVMALAVYGTWYGLNTGNAPEFEDVPTVESRIAGLMDAQATEPDSVPTSSAQPEARQMAETRGVIMPVINLPQSLQRPMNQPESTPSAAVENAAPVSVAMAAMTSTVRDSIPIDAIAGSQNDRITLRARRDTWVRIEGPGSEAVMDAVLRAGESYEATAGQGLSLMTGNAGALDVLVNGQLLGVLGPEGAIRRDVSLDVAALRDVSGHRAVLR
ncbi:MAG: RodZ domain-containing protein [Sphingomonadales bacterium]